ncbi:MAG: helix-hairpin-helix domain-containing protein, partial [Ignavibacteria bacterium]|nr:helix-hairpin-helix domain-containing protein [Ignavibacteria bacterium]
RNIKNYEAKGGKFFIKEDLKKIYSISAAEYAALEPFITIQSPTEGRAITTKEVPQSNFETKEYTAKKILLEAVELNTIDSVQLTEIPGIGQWFAHRIIQYRTILGGFVSKNQLLEVYGIDSTKYTQMEGNFKIDASLIQPLRINRLTFKELIQHPYLDYNLTKAIVNQRDKRGFIRSEEELARLSGFNATLIQKLRPYLNYD